MNKNSLDNIIQKIDERGISPLPRWHFLLKRSVFWIIAGISVLLGGVAIAVITFIFFDHDLNVRNYVNQSLVDYVLLTIPYIWLAALAFLITVAQLSIRHSKNGYRYSVMKLIGAALAASLVAGLLLNVFDAGENINEFLNESIPYYQSLVYTSKDAWSQPEKGLLGGVVVSVQDENTIVIQDFHRKQWLVHLMLAEKDDGPSSLHEGDVFKIVGKVVGKGVFQAERLYSWKQ